MQAIISDIHGNLEALEAVLNDAASQGATDVYCLGNVFAFGGANPRECVDLAMQWRCVLLGKHDLAAFAAQDSYPAYAQNALRWAWSQVIAGDDGRRQQFIEWLPRDHAEPDFLLVHGSPRNPLQESVELEDVFEAKKVSQLFSFVERYCFVGRTQQPGILTEDCRVIRPKNVGLDYRLDERKVIINVGSVGQPRDKDWRASYVLLDGDMVRFRRVEYDVETAIRKVYAIAELENSLGDRLREGR
jgi:diadenosine tetraphosphatase ApaH/serine/threonine PP2A family protein phosphatase